MVLSLFFGLPLAIAIVVFVLWGTGERKGLAKGVLVFFLTVAIGTWAIFQSRASTAGIGMLFLPFYGSVVGALAWFWGRFRGEPGMPWRAGAWLAFAAALALPVLLVRSGFKERDKNASRDLEVARAGARIDTHRAALKELLARAKGRETEALDEALKEHGDDREFLIPALETEYVSTAALERLSRHPDMGVVLGVARHKRTPPAVLERIYKESRYPDYYVQALAANPNTPVELLLEFAGSKNAWVLKSLLENRTLDCGLAKAVRSSASRLDLEDRNHAVAEIQEKLDRLEPALCRGG